MRFQTLFPLPTQTVEGAKVMLHCNFRGKGDRQGHMDKRDQLKSKTKQKKPQIHGSEGTPNYIDTLYIARVIVTIIQAGTYCTELKLYGFKKLVYIFVWLLNRITALNSNFLLINNSSWVHIFTYKTIKLKFKNIERKYNIQA